MEPDFILYVAAQLITIGIVYGIMTTKIKYIEKSIDRLERKQDKHNGLITRMVLVEKDVEGVFNKIVHHIDDDKKDSN